MATNRYIFKRKVRYHLVCNIKKLSEFLNKYMLYNYSCIYNGPTLISLKYTVWWISSFKNKLNWKANPAHQNDGLWLQPRQSEDDESQS